jgi:glyoxylase I family protein
MIKSMHHIAVICSDYNTSKAFYTDILGLVVLRETFREERNSYKLDLALNGEFLIELFSFPDPPKRVSNPESAGLRHLAFSVEDINESVNSLLSKGIELESIRVDEFTGKKFTFFKDPDGLPIELYEL